MRRLAIVAAFAFALLALFAGLTTTRQPAAKPHVASAVEGAVDFAPQTTPILAARARGTAKPPSDPHDRYPHPITEEHKRLYREADLIEGAAALLRKGDVAEARAKLATYRAEYAEGHGDDSEGLALLADCIERRDAAAVAGAQAFYDRYTHSMVRRQIRKQCLEPGAAR